MKVPTSVSQQVGICTKSLCVCIADFYLVLRFMAQYKSIQVYIYRIKMMTTCRVLYLSDPPIMTQICREFSPTVYIYCI